MMRAICAVCALMLVVGVVGVAMADTAPLPHDLESFKEIANKYAGLPCKMMKIRHPKLGIGVIIIIFRECDRENVEAGNFEDVQAVAWDLRARNMKPAEFWEIVNGEMKKVWSAFSNGSI
jgi:hypothetical protein